MPNGARVLSVGRSASMHGSATLSNNHTWGSFCPIVEKWVIYSKEMNFPTPLATRTLRNLSLFLSIMHALTHTHTQHISLIKCQKARYENQCSIVCTQNASQLIRKGKGGTPWGWLFDKPTANDIYSHISCSPLPKHTHTHTHTHTHIYTHTHGQGNSSNMGWGWRC